MLYDYYRDIDSQLCHPGISVTFKTPLQEKSATKNPLGLISLSSSGPPKRVLIKQTPSSIGKPQRVLQPSSTIRNTPSAASSAHVVTELPATPQRVSKGVLEPTIVSQLVNASPVTANTTKKLTASPSSRRPSLSNVQSPNAYKTSPSSALSSNRILSASKSSTATVTRQHVLNKIPASTLTIQSSTVSNQPMKLQSKQVAVTRVSASAGGNGSTRKRGLGSRTTSTSKQLPIKSSGSTQPSQYSSSSSSVLRSSSSSLLALVAPQSVSAGSNPPVQSYIKRGTESLSLLTNSSDADGSYGTMGAEIRRSYSFGSNLSPVCASEDDAKETSSMVDPDLSINTFTSDNTISTYNDNDNSNRFDRGFFRQITQSPALFMPNESSISPSGSGYFFTSPRSTSSFNTNVFSYQSSANGSLNNSELNRGMIYCSTETERSVVNAISRSNPSEDSIGIDTRDNMNGVNASNNIIYLSGEVSEISHGSLSNNSSLAMSKIAKNLQGGKRNVVLSGGSKDNGTAKPTKNSPASSNTGSNHNSTVKNTGSTRKVVSVTSAPKNIKTKLSPKRKSAPLSKSSSIKAVSNQASSALVDTSSGNNNNISSSTVDSSLSVTAIIDQSIGSDHSLSMLASALSNAYILDDNNSVENRLQEVNDTINHLQNINGSIDTTSNSSFSFCNEVMFTNQSMNASLGSCGSSNSNRDRDMCENSDPVARQLELGLGLPQDMYASKNLFVPLTML